MAVAPLVALGTHLLVLRSYDDADKLIDKPEWWTPLPEGPKERGRRRDRDARGTDKRLKCARGTGSTKFISAFRCLSASF